MCQFPEDSISCLISLAFSSIAGKSFSPSLALVPLAVLEAWRTDLSRKSRHLNFITFHKFCLNKCKPKPGFCNKKYFYRNQTRLTAIRKAEEGFPGGAVVEGLPANAGDTGSSPGLGGSRMPWSN